MELSQVVRRRRMVRSFDPTAPVPEGTVQRLLAAAVRAPSAGFTQGWDFLVLDRPGDVGRFWEVTTDPQRPADSWLRGMRTAPVLVVCLSHPQAYLDRYAEPDKGWSDRDPGRWPVPYWDVDTGMAALLMLLTAVDVDLGACFFGVPAERWQALREAFAVPADRRPVGVVAVGHPAPDRPSPSLRRGRRGPEQVAHRGRFGQPWSTDPD